MTVRRIIRNLPFVGGRLPSASLLLSNSQRRYLPEWFRSQRKDYLLDHAIPWFTYDSINFLRSVLTKGIRFFEFGAGASTLFWWNYCSQCVSVEDNSNWYQTVRSRLDAGRSRGCDVDLRLVPP